MASAPQFFLSLAGGPTTSAATAVLEAQEKQEQGYQDTETQLHLACNILCTHVNHKLWRLILDVGGISRRAHQEVMEWLSTQMGCMEFWIDRAPGKWTSAATEYWQITQSTWANYN